MVLKFLTFEWDFRIMDCDNWDIPKILIFIYKYDKTLTYRSEEHTSELSHRR